MLLNNKCKNRAGVDPGTEKFNKLGDRANRDGVTTKWFPLCMILICNPEYEFFIYSAQQGNSRAI